MKNLHDQMLDATRKVSHAKAILAKGLGGLGRALMADAIKTRIEVRKRVEAENAKMDKEGK